MSELNAVNCEIAAAEREQANLWLRRIHIVQLAIIVTLLVSQLVVCLTTRVPLQSRDMLVSSGCLFGLGSLMFVLNSCKAHKLVELLLLALEVILVTVASYTALIAGVPMLYLATAAKVRLLTGRVTFGIVCAAILLLFWVSEQNPHLGLGKASLGDADAMLEVLGRDLIGFASGLVLVVVLVEAIVSELKNRLEAERLSATLATLATELERNRISREINSNVDNILVRLKRQVDSARTAVQEDETSGAASLSEAKELASSALTEVRRSLSLLRSFEAQTVQSLIEQAESE